MASQFPPKKNTAFTLYFTLYKNDGTVIVNPGTITKKRSIDGAAVADIAASVTEEDTTYGQCSVVLSADDMNGDAIWVYIVDNTSGCVPFTVTIYTAAQTLDEIKVETSAILTDTAVIGALGAGLTGIPWNSAWDAEVQSECADALAAYDPPTKAEMDTGLDALPTAAEIKTAIEVAGGHLALILEDTGTTLNGKIDTIDGIVDNILVDTGTTLDTLIKDIPTVAEFEARTLVAADYTVVGDLPTPPTAAAIADAVWDEAATGHTDAGKAGAQMWTDIDAIAVDVAGLDGAAMRGTDDAALASVCTEARLAELSAANLPADVAAVKSDTTAILTDTGTTLDTLIKDIPTVAEFEARTLVAADYTVVGDLPAAAPSAASIADAVCDELLADHTGVGSVGAGISAASASGDPWSTALPGSYGAGTAGKIIGDNLNAPVGTVDTVVDSLATTLGVAGAGLTALPWNAAWDAEVQSECLDALSDYDPPTKGELDAGLDALPTAAEIKTAVEAAGGKIDSILTDTGTTLDALIKDIPTVAEFEARSLPAADYTVVSDLIPASSIADAVWDEAIAGHAEVGSTGEALSEAGAAGTPPTVGEIADAVWDEALADHDTAGSTGAGVSSASSAGDPWSTPIPGEYVAGTAGKIIGDNLNAPVATVDTVVDAIKAKTDQLGFTVANRVDATSIAADKTGYSLTSAYDAAKLAASQSSLDALDAIADAIKSKTDLIPASPAAVSDIPTVDDIWDEPSADHQVSGSMAVLLGSVTAGAGSVEEVVTVTDGTDPLDGVSVWVSTDSAGANVVAGPLYTDASGQATFMLDPGTYHVWKQLSGYNFTNPESMVIS